MGSQVIEDSRRHGIEYLKYMDHKWGAFLGRTIYKKCERFLEKPMQLLALFEKAGKAAEEKHVFLSWIVPVTNFPCVQEYTSGKVKKVWVQYGPPQGPRRNTNYYENTLQLAVCHTEIREPTPRKQALGAAPNIVHSLDAAHLMMTLDRAKDYHITTIHDSFGGLFADIPNIYKIVRETFYELYMTEPLDNILEQIGQEPFEKGLYDVSDILKSEYAFS